MSENGAENCVVDCEEAGRGFYFHSGEGSYSVIQGFTIKNGLANNGGGIYCGNNSSPIITSNMITGNTSTQSGGGIACLQNSSPTITGNTIMGNTSQPDGDFGGGGICCRNNSSPIITDNTITENTAGWGGGIHLSDFSSAIITGNKITGNAAVGFGEDGGGGGILSRNSSSPTITGNTITGNEATDSGGGISLWYEDSPIVEENTISGNTTNWGGGLICGYTSMTSFKGNKITGNVAIAGAGGINVWYSSITINNNTIAENYTEGYGGGISCEDDCVVLITNTIFWNNSGETGDEISIGYFNSSIPSTLTITYSDVEGGEDLVFVDEGCTLNWLPGMINDDPLFVLPGKRDYRLLWESPCIDSGHPGPQYNDPDGTRCDMGTHFFDQDDYLTLYVTPDTTEVSPGGKLGVTYTAINRWDNPEPFWVWSQVTLPGGNTGDVVGPYQYNMPADTTIQIELAHDIPVNAPAGMYDYWSRIGIPPGTLYDQDNFNFTLIE
jgi:parallel beta-helix repeat protein/predicted outer membrane repeat protein